MMLLIVARCVSVCVCHQPTFLEFRDTRVLGPGAVQGAFADWTYGYVVPPKKKQRLTLQGRSVQLARF